MERGEQMTASASRERQVSIRAPVPADAEPIALLATQLGYPSTSEQVRKRLLGIEGRDGHFVRVAELADGTVAGWIHALVNRTLESDPRAEIAGLVVDESRRGSGIGKLLMRCAEDWARGRGLAAVYLRSNVIRTGAHAFYSALGYERIKTQHAFLKTL